MVKPIRFPGGSIGELAVNGTVNDLAMAGARPLALSLSLILEEGLDADELRAEVEAIAAAADAAGVEIVAGDTKVVERGHADRCTSARPASAASTRAPRSRRRRSGPATGSSSPGRSATHGTAIMLARGEFELDAEIESDTRSLWPAADALLEAAGPSLRAMRDATRGGVASVLNELARASGVAMVVREARRAGRPGRRGRGGDPRDRPDVRRQRGRARRLRRRRRRAEAALAALRGVDGRRARRRRSER